MGSFRFATVLVYLNDDYSGGGTFFPKRNYTVTPKQGKVIMFYNLSPTNRNVLESSLHGGLPVTEGKKYICNFWIRLKPIKS
jgi:prolyl 4-hydroxylase